MSGTEVNQDAPAPVGIIFAENLSILKPQGRWCVAFLLLTMALLMPGSAGAQQCSSGSYAVSFGTVSTSSATDITASVPYQCQANASNTYYTVCFFVPGGNESGTGGVAPRRMTDYNSHFVDYNLHSDAARTQIIGPPPTGSGYPVYSLSFMVPGGWSSPARKLDVYGRVPPIPAGTPAGNYSSQIPGAVLNYAWSNMGSPPDCFTPSGGGMGSASVYGSSSARVSNSCRIAINQANDLNFGSVASLASAVEGTSTITLSCPSNTRWKLGLNDGLNAMVAGQRRMVGPSPDSIRYELYRDASRTQRWGNDTAGGTNTASGSGTSQTNPTVLTVYGRVPAQAVGAPGHYVDTVTVTLTY